MGGVIGGCGDRSASAWNYFIDRGVGGIDGISYSGIAEPADYSAIAAMNGIPARLISFTVTFIADGKTVNVQEIAYGGDTARIEYPEIPEKDGCFGRWPEISDKTVTGDIELICEYNPYITVISSPEKSGELPLALAEGSFTDKAEIHAVKTGEDIYDIELNGLSEEGSITLRLLASDGGKLSGRTGSEYPPKPEGSMSYLKRPAHMSLYG